MDATSPLATGVRDAADIVQQMKGILRDEIARGALANIDTATGVWSAHRRDQLLPALARRLTTEFSDLLNPVLDLIAPVLQPDADRQLPSSDHVELPLDAERLGESVPVLRGLRAGVPGGTMGIRTALRNDGPTSVEVGFLWSDLVAEPDGHIPAENLHLLPGRLTVPTGAVADVVILLRVPADASPGLYHSLLETTDDDSSRALLLFRIGGQGHQEARSARVAVRGRD
jgi:hypothetical protein